jgi:hypothetical protein
MSLEGRGWRNVMLTPTTIHYEVTMRFLQNHHICHAAHEATRLTLWSFPSLNCPPSRLVPLPPTLCPRLCASVCTGGHAGTCASLFLCLSLSLSLSLCVCVCVCVVCVCARARACAARPTVLGDRAAQHLLRLSGAGTSNTATRQPLRDSHSVRWRPSVR